MIADMIIMKTLSDLCDIRTGKVDVNSGNPNGPYPFFTCARQPTFSDVYDFDCEAILIAGNGEVGLSHHYNGKFQAYQRTYVLCNFNGVNGDYLKYAIDCNLIPHLREQTHGAAIPYIKKGGLSSCPIPIPPLPEQERIVAKLDAAFAAIDQAKANVERNLHNAKELFQSKLNEVFSQKGDGWVEKKLKDVGHTQTGSTPKTAEPENYGDFMPFVKPGHFKEDGSIDVEDSYLSEIGTRKTRVFGANSVLMVCIGATIGKTGFSEIPVTSNQQINALTPKDGLFGKFFYYAMIDPSFFNEVVFNASQATLPIMSKSKWENLTVSYPNNFTEQKSIADSLDALRQEIMKLQTQYTQKLLELEELKKSLLDRAFRGEI